MQTSKYNKVFIHDKESRHYVATMRNHIVNESGDLVFAEFVGQKEDVKKIVNSISGVHHTSIIVENENNITRTSSGYSHKFESLQKGYYASIWSKSIKGNNATLLLGKDMAMIYELFKKWLIESQPLPYARGFVEELGDDAENALFDLLVKQEHITQLSDEKKHTILAFEISRAILNASQYMQDAILQIVKASGLLEIDRLRSMLSKNAPALDESDPDNAKIWVSLRNAAENTTYHITEYDENSDSAFCLVKKDEDVLWELHGLDEIFNNANIGLLKGNKYKNLTTDMSGTITQSAA